MTAGRGEPLRVALVYHGYGEASGDRTATVVRDVAASLLGVGVEPSIICSRVGVPARAMEDGVRVIRTPRLPEAPLWWRGFTGPLTHLPLVSRHLAGTGYDVTHAFSPPDAHAALSWSRRTGGPVVFTCAETLDRDRLADRRLRLRLLSDAVEQADVVVVPSEAAGAALRRWFAVEPVPIDARDGAGHERLYRRLLAERLVLR